MIEPVNIPGRVARWVITRRRWATLWILVAVAIITAGALRMRVDFSSSAFFGGDPKLRADMDRFVELWGSDDDVLALVVSNHDQSTTLTSTTLEALDELETLLSEIDGVEEVHSLASIPIRAEGRRRLAADWLLDDAGRDTVRAARPHVPLLLRRTNEPRRSW